MSNLPNNSTQELPDLDEGPQDSQTMSSTTADDAASRMTGSTRDVASSMTGSSKKTKNPTMYHHMKRHVHKPHEGRSAHARAAMASDLEMQPLSSEGTTVDEVWDDPVRYITSHEMGMSMFGFHLSRSGVRCIRSIKMKLIHTNDSGETEEYEASGHWSFLGMLIHKRQYHNEVQGAGDRYLVIGRMSTNGYIIKEKIIRYPEGNEDEMLRRVHKAVRGVRGMRGMFSLKSMSGFGLYQCDPSAGHHTRVELSESQRSCLRSFYNSYQWRSRGGPEFLWDDWMFKHLNNSSKHPAEGKYSIEILLSWSVWRLSIATSIPVLLSLAVGLWYQTMPVKDGADPTGTAWIIATYIITAGALIIAFLGVATGLEQS